ncbi:MAG: class I SAM-dependent methyltransferase [Candidatus Adiutrix sp.]|nr:class I SAM-dependent methyltransferase [Candidatus Adiutrix sp.]
MEKNTLTSAGIYRNGFLFKLADFIEHGGACPVCGHEGARKVVSVIMTEANICFLECPKCFAVSSSHYLKPSVLDEYYSQYFSLRGLGDLNVGMENYQNYSKFLSSVLNFDKDSIRILDYGGGGGVISYEVAQNLSQRGKCQRVEAVVVDYSDNIMAFKESEAFAMSHMEPDTQIWKEMKFDVVMANDVIEHIFHVKPVIESLFDCVERGGFLVIKTGYNQPIYNFLLKAGWQNLPLILYPEHIHDFSKRFFSHFFTTFNQDDYEVIASGPSFFAHKLFGPHFLAALAARIIRFPYHLFKDYPFVGGWQLIARKAAD